MLVDHTCGQKREVDLVIRSNVAGYELVISVECTDRQRPASVEWVEQLHAKHRGLATNKLILISRGGFTEAAVAKANLLGAEPFSLEEARKVEWAKCVDRYSKVFLIAIDARTIARVMSPTCNSGTEPLRIPMATEFLDAQGRVHATAEEMANALIRMKSIFGATFEKINSLDRAGWEILFPFKPGIRMRLPTGVEHQVDSLQVAILADPLVVPFSLKRASFRGAEIAFAEAQHKSGDMLMTILETEGAALSAQVRVRRPWGELQTYQLAGNSVGDVVPVASDETMRALIGRFIDDQGVRPAK
jgi:hypothetical protein